MPPVVLSCSGELSDYNLLCSRLTTFDREQRSGHYSSFMFHMSYSNFYTATTHPSHDNHGDGAAQQQGSNTTSSSLGSSLGQNQMFLRTNPGGHYGEATSNTAAVDVGGARAYLADYHPWCESTLNPALGTRPVHPGPGLSTCHDGCLFNQEVCRTHPCGNSAGNKELTTR